MEEEKKIPDEEVVQPVEEEIPENAHLYEPESFEDDYDSSGLLTGQKYDIPDSADAFVDTGEGKVINKEDLTPFEMIKAIAKQNNSEIEDPDKSCRHCYGRGYEGLDTKTKMPVPCRCLFRGRDEEADNLYEQNKMNRPISRGQKRRMAAMLRKHFKNQKRILKERSDEGKPINLDEEPQTEEISNKEVNQILKRYIKLKSFKKTAVSLDLTLTKTKKVIKENQEKLTKMLDKKGE